MGQFGAVFQRLVRFLLDRLCLLLELLFYADDRAYLPPITDPLLLQSATTLAAKIKSGKIKSEALVRAYISRAREVQPLINAIIDERFEEALAEARALDATISRQLAESGELEDDLRRKPFLGVPYTGKDSIAIKGLRLCSGIPARKDIRAEVDSSVAKLWAEAGAIPPGADQRARAAALVSAITRWDTVNKSFGRTANPYNRALIPGGSTGGNGSLISSCGSLMGIASDIGGSIRLPALFCGLYGHCCSVETVPHRQPLVSYGPLCRYAADLRPLVQMYMSRAEESSALKLSNHVEVSKLRVFYLTSFNDPSLTPTSEPVAQSVRIAAKHLQSLGATVREVKKAEELNLLDGFNVWMAKMHAEDAHPMAFEMTNRTGRLNLLWELVRALVGLSEHTLAVLELKKALPGAQATRERFLEQHRRLKAQLDGLLGDDGVLLLPTYPELSVKPASCFLKFKNTAYTGVFNTLQVAMTSIPLGLTTEEDGVRGGPVPVGIQAIATHLNDHLTLTVAELLDREFGGWVPPTKVLVN
ncbi:Fatty-acid amide hydrolase 2 [Tyrophagus putrescentiae]|nr:Fatty-acid amide hydrolase 2 [Tyrophagus putrescentiae]